MEEKKYQLLTLKEAADYLRMHKGSLYRLLESGKTDIPAIKLGGKWLFNLESLNKYLMEKEMQNYKDWPGFKSTPIEPVHILEED